MLAPKPVLKIHKGTRCVAASFPSVAAAAEESGFSTCVMSDMCRKQALSDGVFYYRFAEDFDPDEDFTGKSRVPVLTGNRLTQEVEWFPSVHECAFYLGVDAGVVRRAARTGSAIDRKVVIVPVPKRLPPGVCRALATMERSRRMAGIRRGEAVAC